jgi:hypothetical protein
MNRKALDIWAKLGSGDKKDGDANGIEESVMLLSEISDIEIITEFSPWIYKANRNRFKVRQICPDTFCALTYDVLFRRIFLPPMPEKHSSHYNKFPTFSRSLAA